MWLIATGSSLVQLWFRCVGIDGLWFSFGFRFGSEMVWRVVVCQDVVQGWFSIDPASVQLVVAWLLEVRWWFRVGSIVAQLGVTWFARFSIGSGLSLL